MLRGGEGRGRERERGLITCIWPCPLPPLLSSYGLSGDTSNATVELDRRMLDFCVGLDTEFSEIVEGSHLYFPKTRFDQVRHTALMSTHTLHVPISLWIGLYMS